MISIIVLLLVAGTIGFFVSKKRYPSSPYAADNGNRDGRFRQFFERANEAIFVVEDGTFIDCNPKTLEMFRCTKDDILGLSPVELSPTYQPDGHLSSNAAMEYIKKAFDGEPQNFEWMHRRLDGEVFFAHVSLSNAVLDGKTYILGFVRDVSDLKLTTDRLTAVVAEQTAITNSLPDLVFKLNRDGRLLWWNNVMESLTGLKESDLQLMPFSKLIPTEDRENFEIALLKTGTEGNAETTLRINSVGDPVTHEFKFVRLEETSDQPMEFTCIGRNVDSQKNIEKALSSIAGSTSAFVGEDFFEALVKQLAHTLGVRFAFVARMDSNNIGSMRTIASWRNGSSDDNYSFMLSGTPAEYVFDHGLTILNENVQKEFLADPLLTELGVQSFAGVPLTDSTGQAIGVLVVMDDGPMHDNLLARSVLSDFALRAGTELDRLQYEEKLSQAAAVFESSDEGIMVTDIGNSIVAINDAFTRITGYSEQEVLGKNPRILRSEREPGSHYKTMWQAIDNLGKWQGEVWNRRKDGSEFPCRLRITTVRDENNFIINYVGVFLDTSDAMAAQKKQRELELQLIQTQKMEALGQLTGGIAHDFNNILASILGYTDLAQGLDPVKQDKKLKEYLDQVYLSGERARDLIAQMLTFSRRSTTGELTPVPLVPIVKEASKMLRPMLAKSISLDVQSEIRSDQSVNSDAIQLHQLIVNLCVNARDAIGDKGNIKITVNNTTLSEKVCSSCRQSFSGDYVRIAVRDDGSGMEPQVVSQIFEPFFTTKDIGKGTGMGLSTVHGIVHNHSGHIHVWSKPGEGTEFEIFFPAISSKGASQSDDEKEALRIIDGQNRRIMVVDDEESIATLIEEQLSQFNFEVACFNDGASALANFLQDMDRYDLVITDQAMPNLLGTEMANQMLKLRPDLPVILCTGYHDPTQTGIVESLKLSAHLTKPVSTAILLKAVEKALTNK